MDEIGRIINLKWLTVIFKTIITNVIHNLYQSNILNSEFISFKIFIFVLYFKIKSNYKFPMIMMNYNFPLVFYFILMNNS